MSFKVSAFLIAVAASSLAAGAAFAVDHGANVPLAPSDAAGPWTLETGGHAVCVIKLSSAKAGNAGFGLTAPATCGAALPAGVTGWVPSGNGMALTGADGQVVLSFGRWSNSLFVSHQSSGVDIQLQRGGPNP
jgi:Protease inhibitor Inh